MGGTIEATKGDAMTDIVSQLVGALRHAERALRNWIELHPDNKDALDTIAIEAIDAAITAAKAGGWAAVPEVATPEMLRAGHESISCVGSCGEASPPEVSDFCDVWNAMLAARPLPNPPKEMQ
jgi:hypothetical protein